MIIPSDFVLRNESDDTLPKNSLIDKAKLTETIICHRARCLRYARENYATKIVNGNSTM